jgi:hypothetical protein
MKAIIFAFLAAFLGLGAVAQAQQAFPTVIQLQRATENGHLTTCIPDSFNADDSVNGVCSYVVNGVGSGRGGAHPSTSYNYNVTWDLNGNVTSGVLCDSVYYVPGHLPAYTFYNGFTQCPVAVMDPNKEVTYVQYGPYSWQYTTYYFVEVSADGLYTLVDTGIVYPATPGVPQS